MDWITTSGGSIDEAKSNALDQLGIVADEAEFDIINDVEKNFFGRVKSEAKVRARVRPKPPATKDERGGRDGGRSRGRGRGKGQGGQGGQGRGQGGQGGQSGQSRQGGQSGQNKNGRKGGGGGGQRGKGGQGSGGQSRDQGGRNKGDGRSDDRQGGQKGGGRERDQGRDSGAERASGTPSSGGRGDGGRARAQESSSGRRDSRATTDENEVKDKEMDNVEVEFSRAEQEQVAVEFLEGLVDVIGMTADVALSPDEAEDGAIELDVAGEELGLLVGPKGSTLNSVQELTRTVVQRASGGARTERLRVDVAGYRERRNAALQGFAQEIAADVLDSGTEKLLEPMGPADRKVVHDAVNEIDGVETGSEGEEPRRRVVIRPVG